MSGAYEQGKPAQMTGAQLANLDVTIDERPGSLLLEYRRSR